MRFADDLRHNMENADRFSRTFQEGVDAFVARNGIDAPLPTDEEFDGEPPQGDWSVSHRPSIDLRDENVTNIVWATGFSYDFSWVDFPVRDEMGYPVMDRGATSVPGLYFMGLNWMVNRKSGLLYGVGDDARHVAAHIARFVGSHQRRLAGAQGTVRLRSGLPVWEYHLRIGPARCPYSGQDPTSPPARAGEPVDAMKPLWPHGVYPRTGGGTRN